MDTSVDVKAIVRGRVQGVGFRATARHHAKKLGLVGTVRNMPDGSVEIRARGTKQLIERLFAILKEEEFPGHIIEILEEDAPLEPSHDSFIITY